MSGIGSELSRISRLTHTSLFDPWLVQLRAILVLRDLDYFIDHAPARGNSDHADQDKRALAIVTLAVDEQLQATAANASNTKVALAALRAATQGSLLDRQREVENNVVELKQQDHESLSEYCKRAGTLEQELLALQLASIQPMLVDRFLEGLHSVHLKSSLASSADLLRAEKILDVAGTVRSHARMLGIGTTASTAVTQPTSTAMVSTAEVIPTAMLSTSAKPRPGRTSHVVPNPQARAPFGHCGYCYAKGHWKKDCPQWQTLCQLRQRNSAAAVASMAHVDPPPEPPSDDGFVEHAI